MGHGSTQAIVVSLSHALRNQVAVEFSFGAVSKSRGKQSEPAAVGKHSPPHNAEFTPTITQASAANVATCQTRCRRKSKPADASPESPLPLTSFDEESFTQGSTNLVAETENRQARQSLPKKRSIDQMDQTGKEIHIKKPRCSLPRSLCAGGA